MISSGNSPNTKTFTDSELSYRNLFNTIEDAIYIQDEAAAFVDVNNSVIKMYGYRVIVLNGLTGSPYLFVVLKTLRNKRKFVII